MTDSSLRTMTGTFPQRETVLAPDHTIRMITGSVKAPATRRRAANGARRTVGREPQIMPRDGRTGGRAPSRRIVSTPDAILAQVVTGQLVDRRAASDRISRHDAMLLVLALSFVALGAGCRDSHTVATSTDVVTRSIPPRSSDAGST